MYIRKIIEENPKDKDEDIESNCLELIQVKKAIEKLDGEEKTAVILKKDETNFMVIGGGQSDKYVVNAVIQGKSYSMASKFDVLKEPIEVVVGGKKKIYPSRKCFNLEMVLESAKHFASRGSLAQTFNWDTN